MSRLDEPLTRAVGPRTAAALEKLGPRTVGDLLRYYPRRWAEPGRMTDLADLRPGEHVTVMARVRHATVRTMRSRAGALLEVVVTDDRRDLHLVFFAKHASRLHPHESRLLPGRVGLFSGVVSDRGGTRQLTHPDYVLVGVHAEDEAAAIAEASRPVPVYPASASMPSWKVQAAVRTVLDPTTADDLPDPLPDDVRAEHDLVGLHQALRDVHEPYTAEDWRRGLHRLRYEEAFVLQAELVRRRVGVAQLAAAPRPVRADGLLAAFDARLPWPLTAGQREVGEQIAADLAGDHPMQRLLQGEVGSGKTVVALRAMLQVVDAGGQAALLAPTEVLAGQHARTLRDLLGELGDAGALWAPGSATRVVLLTGSASSVVRRQALADVASGNAGIVVGTHALLSETVTFADLGLVVVDEQHRFGVQQRDALRERATTTPHLLVMTATPIPRTVAMTVFGDLETSTLREVPAGRAAVETHVVPADKAAWLERTWQRVREEVDRGGRAYVVCPRIDADDPVDADTDLVDDAAAAGYEGPEDAPDGPTGAPDGPGDGTLLDLPGVETAAAPARRPLRAVTEVAAALAASPALAGVRVGVLHGRLSAEDKDRALADFASGTVPVLVSTTVVEVGVDVPEATVMVVLDADRFGISQLHQLRGRIGRGDRPGICLLVADAAEGTPAATRLATLAATTDGFELAQVDLELRREGDVLGAAQSGAASSLRLLRVTRDGDLIATARADARRVVDADPSLDGHPALREAIARMLPDDRVDYLERA